MAIIIDSASGAASETSVPFSKVPSKFRTQGLSDVCGTSPRGEFGTGLSSAVEQISDELSRLLDARLRKQEQLLETFLEEMRSTMANKPGKIHEQNLEDSKCNISSGSSHDSSRGPVMLDRGPSETSMVSQQDAEHLSVAQRRSAELQNEKEQTESRKQAGCRYYAECLLSRREFDPLVNLVVLLNVVLIGIEADASSRAPGDEIPEVFGILNYVFVSFYLAELLLRCCGSGGVRGYLWGPDASWNRYDLALVVGAVVEIIGNAAVRSSSDAEQLNMSLLRMLRLIRLARLLRGFRFLKYLRYVSSLQTLVYSILESAKLLLWTCLLLVMIMYLWAVMLMQVVSDHCRFEVMALTGERNASPTCTEEALEMHWNGLLSSMLTLFMSVTGGLEWKVVVYALGREVGWYAAAIFFIYVFFTVFAALNIVTGVFCHSAIESASCDKDIAAMRQVANHTTYVENIRCLFKDIDDDASEQISLAEFQAALSNAKLSAYLESIGVATENAWTLFSMIDADGDGSLDLDEFVAGCMLLRGPAKAIHLAKMNMDNKLTRKQLAKMYSDVRAIDKKLDVMIAESA